MGVAGVYSPVVSSIPLASAHKSGGTLAVTLECGHAIAVFVSRFKKASKFLCPLCTRGREKEEREERLKVKAEEAKAAARAAKGARRDAKKKAPAKRGGGRGSRGPRVATALRDATRFMELVARLGGADAVLERMAALEKAPPSTVPATSTCPKCEREGSTAEMFGLRVVGGKQRAQSWCRDCRQGRTARAEEPAPLTKKEAAMVAELEEATGH